MRSDEFRKVLIPFSYAAIVTSSLIDWLTPAPPVLRWGMRAAGVVLFVLSAIIAWRVHSMFPAKHDRPEDFPSLLKEGPYRYCRHPFYSALILNQISIPMIMHSLIGTVFFGAFLPAWYLLIRLEEAELISFWGEEYLTYMRKVPAIIPRPWRASDKAEHITD